SLREPRGHRSRKIVARYVVPPEVLIGRLDLPVRAGRCDGPGGASVPVAIEARRACRDAPGLLEFFELAANASVLDFRAERLVARHMEDVPSCDRTTAHRRIDPPICPSPQPFPPESRRIRQPPRAETPV